MANQQQQRNLRPSWNSVMDIDQEHCAFPSLQSDAHRPQRRSVSFSPKSTLLLYEEAPEEDDSQQELWYTQEDEDRFKADAQRQLAAFRRLQSGAPDGCSLQQDDELCIVGLEGHLVSPQFTKKRVRTKRLVIFAVKLEQARCSSRSSNSNSDKAERIANAVMRHSEWSTVQAAFVGDFQYSQSREE